MAKHPDRFAGFAAIPMQNPDAAEQELERAVRHLGFKGALVNGYSDVGDAGTGEYYDLPKFHPFWERVEALPQNGRSKGFRRYVRIEWGHSVSFGGCRTDSRVRGVRSTPPSESMYRRIDSARFAPAKWLLPKAIFRNSAATKGQFEFIIHFHDCSSF
jgi:hypothetical protein